MNGDLTNGNVEEDFKISPDSQYVVYTARQDSQSEELFAAPLGGGAAFRLNGTMQALGSVTGFQISADSSTVVYRADQDTDNLLELYRVPLAGGNAVRLSGAEVTLRIGDFAISPDSSRAVFENERHDGNRLATDIYSVPLTGGTPLRLNNPLPSGGFVRAFQINGAGDRVVFEGSTEVARRYEISSVPIEGGTVAKLSGDMTGTDGTRSFLISPDDTAVVFGVDRDPSSGAQILKMLVTPISGGASMRLAGPLPADRRTRQIGFDPSGTSVVYLADQAARNRYEIFSVPLDGSREPRRMNRPVPDGASVGATGNPDFQFSDDGRFILFLADQETVGVTELWSVELACSSIFSDGFETL